MNKASKSYPIFFIIFFWAFVSLACGSSSSGQTTPASIPTDGSNGIDNSTKDQTSTNFPANTPVPTATPSPTKTPNPTRTPNPTETPTLTPTPILGLVKIGTYLVGKDIQPGIYWGNAGGLFLDSCYWARLKDLTGDVQSIISNSNSVGQFYIEISETDFAFETACELIELKHAPTLDASNQLAAGMYILGRDIQPGLYKGMAGEDILDSCYWARLKDVSGDLSSIIANDNALGSYFIQVLDSDFAIITACPLEFVEQ